MVVISVYTYGVKIILKFRWESGFLWGGFHGTPPLCTNGSAGYLMQLSVKTEKGPETHKIHVLKHFEPKTDLKFGIFKINIHKNYLRA